jgi:hypothetical protein
MRIWYKLAISGLTTIGRSYHAENVRGSHSKQAISAWRCFIRPFRFAAKIKNENKRKKTNGKEERKEKGNIHLQYVI